jgi:hypothetical protein
VAGDSFLGRHAIRLLDFANGSKLHLGHDFNIENLQGLDTKNINDRPGHNKAEGRILPHLGCE